MPCSDRRFALPPARWTAASGVLVLALVATAPLQAQTTPAPTARVPEQPSNMTTTQLQGVSCIVTGLATAAGAVLYSNTVAAAVDWSLPVVLAPVIAGAYAIGCTVGATTGPGVHWLYARYVGNW
ncbi:MAG: hypothetical protein AB7F35_16420 [Acetobacteraceae bacterium]